MQTCRAGKLTGPRTGNPAGVGDFEELVRRYRRELHEYCYRMLAPARPHNPARSVARRAVAAGFVPAVSAR